MSNWRIYFTSFIIVLVGAGIVARMFFLQVVKNGYYAALAQGQHAEYAEFDPPRGSIFFQDKFNFSAHKLFTAAAQKKWMMLYAVPKEIADPEIAAANLAPILAEWKKEKRKKNEGLEKSESEQLKIEQDLIFKIEQDLLARLGREDDPYEPVMSKLSEEQVKIVSDLHIKGVYGQEEELRYYPGGMVGSHVLGFVGYKEGERAGQYGVEGFYDDILRGSKGTTKISLWGDKDSGSSFRKGSDLTLSIDYNIQFMLEEKLRKAKEMLGAEGGSAIVMHPKTGEIIALAATGGFDPNEYSRVESIDIFLNDAVQKMFEPGSIFKPFTMAAALDAGVISPTTEYEDKGYVVVRDRTIKNANQKVYGKKNMTNVLELSLNTGAVFVGQRLGREKFREYLQGFGFGAYTGIDLQGEVAGDIQNLLTTSRDVNFATASFGQGLAVTPVQLITAFSAFANGGKMLKPHVVSKVGELDGGKQSKNEPEIISEPISAKTAAQITDMLISVVENGYSKKAAVRGYKVAGKSGTAQVSDKEKGGYSEKTIHSFIGFAPAYDPRFVALIKLDDPKGINFSSDSAAPIFSEVAEYILNYYEIPPDS